MGRPPETYTAEELVQALKDRKGDSTLQQFAGEVNISYQLLSQILLGTRSVANKNVLDYLAPRGMKYIKKEVYELVKK